MGKMPMPLSLESGRCQAIENPQTAFQGQTPGLAQEI